MSIAFTIMDYSCLLSLQTLFYLTNFYYLCKVSRKIVEAHSGSIHVYSEGEVNKGSTFYIDIPVVGIKQEFDCSSKKQKM